MPISSASRVLVLGGTSGIGLAVAKGAAAQGPSVVVASRNPASVEAALADLPAGSVGRAADASSAEELAALFEFAGDFDHLAYTAADHLVPTPLAEYTVDKGRAFFELRLVAVFEAIYGPRSRKPNAKPCTTASAAGSRSAGSPRSKTSPRPICS
jgi:NAD(P)-dependent dehydrogenase (short-subunit alcohol dehydrogenase family)